MNLNAFKPRKVTDDLLTLITKNNGTLIQQTQTKAQEILEFEYKI